MPHTHELPTLAQIHSADDHHVHSYVPTSIAMENTPLGPKPLQVMMCACGHVRAVYVPRPIDQAEELNT